MRFYEEVKILFDNLKLQINALDNNNHKSKKTPKDMVQEVKNDITYMLDCIISEVLEKSLEEHTKRYELYFSYFEKIMKKNKMLEEQLTKILVLICLSQIYNADYEFSDVIQLLLLMGVDKKCNLEVLKKIAMNSQEKDIAKRNIGFKAQKILDLYSNHRDISLKRDNIEYDKRRTLKGTPFYARYYGAEGLKQIFEKSKFAGQFVELDIADAMHEVISSKKIQPHIKYECTEYLLSINKRAGIYLYEESNFIIKQTNLMLTPNTFHLTMLNGDTALVKLFLKSSPEYVDSLFAVKKTKLNKNTIEKDPILKLINSRLDTNMTLPPMLSLIIMYKFEALSEKTMYAMLDLLIDYSGDKNKDLAVLINFLYDTRSFDIINHIILEKNVSPKYVDNAFSFYYKLGPDKQVFDTNLAYYLLMQGIYFELAVKLLQDGFYDKTSSHMIFLHSVTNSKPKIVELLLPYLDPYELDENILELAVDEDDPHIFNLILHKETRYIEKRNKQLAAMINKSEITTQGAVEAIMVITSFQPGMEINDNRIKECQERIKQSGLLITDETSFFIITSIIMHEGDQVSLVELLLKSGFSAKCYNYLANMGGSDNMGLPPNAIMSLLSYAASFSAIKIVQLLMLHGVSINRSHDDEHFTPLIHAAMNAKFKMLNLLISNGADISENCQSNPSYPPLYYFLYYSTNLNDDFKSVARLFMDKIKISENIKSCMHGDCIMYADKFLDDKGLMSDLSLLIKKHYEVIFFEDILFEQASSFELFANSFDIKKFLIVFKDTIIKDKLDQNSKFTPSLCGGMFYFLLPLYALATLQSTDEDKKIRGTVVSKIPDLKLKKFLMTVINDTWSEDSINNMRFIIEFFLNNFDLSILTSFFTLENKLSPLYWASIAKSDAIVKMLIDKGAKVEHEQSGVIFSVASSGNLEIFKMLLGVGAPLYKYDDRGLSLLDQAILNNRLEITQYIVDNLNAISELEPVRQEYLKKAFKLAILNNASPEIRSLLKLHLKPEVAEKLEKNSTLSGAAPLQPVTRSEKYLNYDPQKEMLFDFFPKPQVRCFIRINQKTLDNLPDGGKQFKDNLQFNQEMGLFGYRIVPVNKNSPKYEGAEFKMRFTNFHSKMRFLFTRANDSECIKISENSKETVVTTFNTTVKSKH